MFRSSRIIWWALVFTALAGVRPATAQQFKVVVNGAADVSSISSTALADIFRKKSRQLPDGTAAVPVDLPASSSIREAFSQAVHGRGTSAMEAWWQQQIFAGKEVPPESKASEAEVLSFVASTPGAIGYVAAGAPLPAGVEEVPVN